MDRDGVVLLLEAILAALPKLDGAACRDQSRYQWFWAEHAPVPLGDSQ